MPGENVRAVFVFYVSEDRQQPSPFAQPDAECVRVEKFVQPLGQQISCHSPNEISHFARLWRQTVIAKVLQSSAAFREQCSVSG